jgi:hypothetical protein
MPWEWYWQIFKHARQHKIPVYAIDCPPRNQLTYIKKRDRYAAEKIGTICEKHPESKIVVIHGESHLASNHLPARVDRQLQKKKLEKKKLIIVQNIDEIYWKLAQLGKSDEDVVRIDEERFCVLNLSPIVKYEHYLSLLERWKEVYPDDDDIDLSPTIYNMIDTILHFLRIDKFKSTIATRNSLKEKFIDVFPEIYSFENKRTFVSILRSQDMAEDQIETILHHVQRHGSCYIPKLNCIFIGEFLLNDGGEEASHFIHFAWRGLIYEHALTGGSKSDRFYQHVLEEALGYFGSKIINPKRNHFRDGDIYKFYRKSREEIENELPYDYETFIEITEFIIMHKTFEMNYHEMDEIPSLLYEGIASTGEKYTTLIHELGYFLGEQLYEGFHKGLITIKQLQKLFKTRFDKPMLSLEIYLNLVEDLNKTVVPVIEPASKKKGSAKSKKKKRRKR